MMNQIKFEVAVEVLSLCVVKSLYEKDEAELHKLNELKEQVYKGDGSTIELVLNEYGNGIKNMLVKKMNLKSLFLTDFKNKTINKMKFKVVKSQIK